MLYIPKLLYSGFHTSQGILGPYMLDKLSLDKNILKTFKLAANENVMKKYIYFKSRHILREFAMSYGAFKGKEFPLS